MNRVLIPVLVLATAVTAGACRNSGTGTKEPVTVAFVTNNSSDFWTIARRGVEKADAELADVTTDFRIDSDGTAAEQKRIIDDLLTRHVAGIAISPVDPQNQTPLLDDVAKQAIVFTQDSDAPNSQRACYVGTDNVAAGRQAGQLIKDALPDGGRIMLFVGRLDAKNAQDRIAGIREVLQGSTITIIDVRTDDVDDVRAKSNAADTLVKYPDVKALVGLWSYNGPAIVNAVREAGKAGAVKIIAFDEADETLAGIRDGLIAATVVQQPYEFGYQSVTLMARALKGDRSFIPANRQIIIPTKVVDKDNVEAFTKQINELRGR